MRCFNIDGPRELLADYGYGINDDWILHLNGGYMYSDPVSDHSSSFPSDLCRFQCFDCLCDESLVLPYVDLEAPIRISVGFKHIRTAPPSHFPGEYRQTHCTATKWPIAILSIRWTLVNLASGRALKTCCSGSWDLRPAFQQ